MTASKTYTPIPGSNYIQGSELVFTTIYAVKVNGIQYDKYIDGQPVNRKHIYTGSLGRVSFPDVFDGTQTVFVMYKKQTTVPAPVPGLCVPVHFTSTLLFDAIVGKPYTQNKAVFGSFPMSLIINDKPAWLEMEIVGSGFIGFVKMTGTPLAAAVENINIDVTNCGGIANLTTTLSSYVNTDNITVASVKFYNKITSVTGITYTVTSGTTGNHRGIHGDYTGPIGVNITKGFFPTSLTLYRNGILLETIPVPVSGTYNFASQVYTSADQIQIIST